MFYLDFVLLWKYDGVIIKICFSFFFDSVEKIDKDFFFLCNKNLLERRWWRNMNENDWMEKTFSTDLSDFDELEQCYKSVFWKMNLKKKKIIKSCTKGWMDPFLSPFSVSVFASFAELTARASQCCKSPTLL